MSVSEDKFERDLLRGSLDLMVLTVLARESQYGYLIQKQLIEVSNGKIKMPAGTLYPLLHRLEKDKLIRSRWDTSTGRKRKWYEITARGKKRVKAQAIQWRQYADCVSGLLDGLLGSGSNKKAAKPI